MTRSGSNPSIDQTIPKANGVDIMDRLAVTYELVNRMDKRVDDMAESIQNTAQKLGEISVMVAQIGKSLLDGQAKFGDHEKRLRDLEVSDIKSKERVKTTWAIIFGFGAFLGSSGTILAMLFGPIQLHR